MRKNRQLSLMLALLLPGAAGAASLHATIVDAQGNALADAVVFAEPLNGKLPASRTRASIDQVDRQFTPYVSIVQTGTAISFPNKDNIRHHVYSFSAARTFDIKLYSGVPVAPVVFDTPGLVVLGCNIHDWMLAYLYVVDTPWFGKSGHTGKVDISALPAGTYRVSSAHPLLPGEPQRQTIVLAQDERISLSIQLKLTAAPAANPAALR